MALTGAALACMCGTRFFHHFSCAAVAVQPGNFFGQVSGILSVFKCVGILFARHMRPFPVSNPSKLWVANTMLLEAPVQGTGATVVLSGIL